MIAVIVVFAALLGFVQEYRAERALEALRQLAAPTATVVRGGREHDVPARELVPGDLVRLAAGDRVPADGRVCDRVNLAVDEAALTGESMPVEKSTAGVDGARPGDRRSHQHGLRRHNGHPWPRRCPRCRDREPNGVRVDRTDARGDRGAEDAAATEPRPRRCRPRARGTRRRRRDRRARTRSATSRSWRCWCSASPSQSRSCPRRCRPWSRSRCRSPHSGWRHRNALVRRLPAVETLGSVSVIGSDKTGTLTADQMTVRRIWVAGETLDVSGNGYDAGGRVPARRYAGRGLGAASRAAPRRRARLRRTARPRTRMEAAAIRGDPTEAALVVAAAKAGIEHDELIAARPRVGEIAFTSGAEADDDAARDSRRLRRLLQGRTRGGAALLLSLAVAAQARSDSTRPIARPCWKSPRSSPPRRFASWPSPVGAEASPESAESEMTLLGLVGMIDPPRRKAKDAIRTCARAGIKPVMITGDHPLTAQAIAGELGLLGSGRVVTGAELDAMSDAELERGGRVDRGLRARLARRTSCAWSRRCRRTATRWR